MPVIQRRGSLVQKIDPKDFVVDFAGAAKTALNLSESMKNNRLNRDKVRQGILNDQAEALLSEQRVKNQETQNKIAEKRLEHETAELTFREREFDAGIRRREADATTAEAGADMAQFKAARVRGDSAWLAMNGARMQSAIRDHDWDEVDEINAEVLSRGIAANTAWEKMRDGWDDQEWTIGNETRKNSEWLALKNAGDDRLGTILTPEQKVLRRAKLANLNERETLKLQNKWDDAQVDREFDLRSKRAIFELENGFRNLNVANEIVDMSNKVIAREEELADQAGDVVAGRDIATFTNAGDRDMNSATILWADKAIEGLASGRIAKDLSAGERAQAIANMKTIKKQAKSVGIFRMGELFDSNKGLVGITGLKHITKDFEDFEDQFRAAGKLDGAAKIKALNAAGKEYYGWLNELAGTGVMDNLQKDLQTLQTKANILAQGPQAGVTAISASRPASSFIESEIEANRTADNPQSLLP